VSVDIFVQRDAGDRRGADIVDPLIGDSIAVAIQRGRNELDAQAHSPQQVRATTLHRVGLELGQHARFFDIDTGEVWDGKIVGIGVRQQGTDLTATLRIERPSNFFI
jgi:hypothetical protein